MTKLKGIKTHRVLSLSGAGSGDVPYVVRATTMATTLRTHGGTTHHPNRNRRDHAVQTRHALQYTHAVVSLRHTRVINVRLHRCLPLVARLSIIPGKDIPAHTHDPRARQYYTRRKAAATRGERERGGAAHF